MPLTLPPSSPFNAALSLFNGLSIIQLVFGNTTLVFEATKLEDNPTQEFKPLERPDRKGVMHKARIIQTKGYEEWTFDLQEVKRVLEIFDGAMVGKKDGTCSLWIPDVDDPNGTVAMQSESNFACTVTRDGKIAHGGGNYSEATIKIESRKIGATQWTKDGIYSS